MNQPNFYAILTANVRYDNRLRPNEKLMFAEITALSNIDGYCTAGNKYFCKLYEKTAPTISHWIHDLNKYGYVKLHFVRKNKQIVERKIYPNTSGGINKNMNTPINKNINTYSYFHEEGINKNMKENTTRDNTKRATAKKSENEIYKCFDENLIVSNLSTHQVKFLIRSIPKWLKSYSKASIEKAITTTQRINMEKPIGNPVSYVNAVLVASKNKHRYKDRKIENVKKNSNFHDYSDEEMERDNHPQPNSKAEINQFLKAMKGNHHE